MNNIQLDLKCLCEPKETLYGTLFKHGDCKSNTGSSTFNKNAWTPIHGEVI